MTVVSPTVLETTQNPTQIDANLSQKSTDLNLSQQQQNAQKEAEQNNTENQDNPNWKAFREARKKDREKREEAERKAAEKEAETAALKAAMEAAFSKSSVSPQAYQQYYGMNQEPSDENEDQRIERKVNALLAAKEQQLLKEQQEKEQREYPQRLSRDLPDFRNVCSQENLDYLDFHYPEISRPLQRLSDGYDKWHDIYHAVKKLIPNHSNIKKDIARADVNSQKPKSISSTGSSPSGEKVLETWQESEKRKADNWARMQRVMKGV